MNPLGLKGFFERMRIEVGFQRFYSSLYDGMRLLYRRIFDEKVMDIASVNTALDQAVGLSFTEESSMQKKKADLEVMVRRKRVDWLAGLSSDWEFEESTKWKEDVPRLPGLRGWTGVKRSGSGAGGKPGKAKRRRLRAFRRCPTVEAAEGRFSAQPSSGLSASGNLPGNPVSGPQQEEEMEVVVVLKEEEEVGIKMLQEVFLRMLIPQGRD